MRQATFVVIISIILALIGWTPAAHSQPAQPTDSISTYTTDDGPHIFWKNDSTAVVFYLCDSSKVSRIFVVRDTLRFSGLCADSSFEYVVRVGEPKPVGAEFDDITKFIAISDLHGDYEHFTEILINAGVINQDLHWSWGNGHLVVNGDVVDRGQHVTECLWLIYRLEIEARQTGGGAHLLLGNHELMVFHNDLRYVHERYLKGISRKFRIPYDDLFGFDMELGRWLRSKPMLLRINDILFVHGGLSPEIIETGLAISDLNRLISEGLNYSAPKVSFDDTIKLIFGSKGPFWYRGFFMEMENRYPASSSEEIDSILARFDVNQIVVGHSQQDSISIFHGGRVIAIDVVVEDIGNQQALLWEDGRFYRVHGSGRAEPLQ